MLIPEKNCEIKSPSSAYVAPKLQAYFRLKDVVRITALSRATIYRRIAVKRFPAPVHLGGRACGWRAEDLQEWIRDPQTYLAATSMQKSG